MNFYYEPWHLRKMINVALQPLSVFKLFCATVALISNLNPSGMMLFSRITQ